MYTLILNIDNHYTYFNQVLPNYSSEKTEISQLTDSSYLLSSEDNGLLKLKASEIITDYIMECHEENLLKSIICNDYPYFENSEKNYILEKALDLIKTNENDFLQMLITLKRRFLIKQDILTYLEDVSEINIIGFIRFRLSTYKKMLSELVEKVIKDYRLQKEYKEFITMLRFFVNTQKNRSNKIHIIVDENNSYTILDEFNVNITKKCFDEFSEANEGSLNNEDLLLSSLIALAPRKIFIHLMTEDYNKKIIKTIEQVFENNVFFNAMPALEVVR